MINPYVFGGAAGGYTFLGVEVDCHLLAENATLSGSDVLTVTDATGNGNTFTAVGSPQYDASGIGGLPSITFDGTNYLERSTNITRTGHDEDILTESLLINVFQLTSNTPGGSYHSVFMRGAGSHTTLGGSWHHLYSTSGTSGVFTHNFHTNALDCNISVTKLDPHYAVTAWHETNGKSYTSFNGAAYTEKSGVDEIRNKVTLIGSWDGNAAVMQWTETIIINTDISDALTSGFLSDLDDYMTTKYGAIF